MESRKSDSQRFMEIYNELDFHMRNILNKPDGHAHAAMLDEMAKKNKVVNKHLADLKMYAKLRNAIVHNPYKNESDPIAEPHHNIVEKYEHLKDKILHPPKALDAVAVKEVFTTTLNARVSDVIARMNKNSFSHVPVMDQGRMIGVFSENTVFSYLVERGCMLFSENLTIGDFGEFIPFDKHRGEYFKFVPGNTTVGRLEEMFHQKLDGKRRLAVVYVTENGSPREELLGVVTAWDITGYEE